VWSKGLFSLRGKRAHVDSAVPMWYTVKEKPL
jgi:hypothetical protein